MVKNYLLIDFGNVNVKWTVYSGANDMIINTRTYPNTTTAREIVNDFYSIRGYDIDSIVECVTSSKEPVDEFNKGLKQVFPRAELKILRPKDFVKFLHDAKYDEKAHPNLEGISIDLLLSALWFRKHDPNACIVNLGSFYYAFIIKNGKFKNLYFLPSISRSIKTLTGNNSSITFDEIPTIFVNRHSLTTKQCLSTGGAMAIEGFIEKIMQDNGLIDGDMILTGGDVDSYPALASRFRVDKDFVVKAMMEFVRMTDGQWDKD